jgi:hypothetical protein
MTVFAVAGAGVIADGWGFVWAAYGLTWAVLGGYAINLMLRSRSTGDSQ